MSSSRASIGSSDADALVAEAVVAGPLLTVRKHRVGFGDFLEAFLGIGVVGIAVGMVLERKPAIGLLEFGVVDTSVDAEHLVVIALAQGTGSAHALSLL